MLKKEEIHHKWNEVCRSQVIIYILLKLIFILKEILTLTVTLNSDKNCVCVVSKKYIQFYAKKRYKTCKKRFTDFFALAANNSFQTGKFEKTDKTK